jgi:hypothetical protein
MMADSFTMRLSPAVTDSRLRMWVAGSEKGWESRDVIRYRSRRRFLQLSEAVPGPLTSVSGRRRLRHGLGCGVDSGNVTTAFPEGVCGAKVRDGSIVAGKRERRTPVKGGEGMLGADPDGPWIIDLGTLDTESATSGRAGLWQSALAVLEISKSRSLRPGMVTACKAAASRPAWRPWKPTSPKCHGPYCSRGGFMGSTWTPISATCFLPAKKQPDNVPPSTGGGAWCC